MAIQPFLASSLIALGGLGAVAALAQSLATPAEFPPASYAAAQYVDSTGCAFVRAGQGDFVNWVPRVSRNREQLCGFVPSLPTAQPAPVAAPTPQQPLVTLAETPPPATAVSTQPDTAKSAIVSLTLADVCEGKSGLQAGFVTANGAAVDCGPAEVATPVVKPDVSPAPVLEPAPAAVAPPPVVVNTPAPVVAEAPPPLSAVKEPALRHVTRAEICAEIAATGKTVIDSATQAPVDCPVVAQAEIAAPAAPVPVSVPVKTQPAPRPATSPFSALQSPAVPASNPDPARVAGESLAPPAGYSRVWTDGRINPHRGLRRITAEEAAAMGLAVR